MPDEPKGTATPSRGWGEMLGFFLFVSIFISLICTGVGVVVSVVYSADSSIHLAYIAVAVGFAFFLMTSQIITHINHSRPMLPIYLISAYGLAIFFYSFLFSLIYGILLIVLILTGSIFHEIEISSMLRILPPVVIVAILTYGTINARILRRRRISLPLLKDGEKIKVILISDLHLGLLVGKTRLNAIMKTMEREKPDIIAVSGDFLDTNPRFLERFEGFVRDMTSIAPVYSVIGNHEFYNGMEDAIEWLRSLGVEVLDNKVVTDPRTGATIIGINDPSAFKGNDDYRMNHERLMDGLNGSGVKVLLNHQPLFFHEAAGKGVDLQLSGHTHGGQIWPFGLGTRAMFKEGDRGLHRFGDSCMYVCQGTGTWGPPLRIGTTSEIIIIELTEKK